MHMELIINNNLFFILKHIQLIINMQFTCILTYQNDSITNINSITNNYSSNLSGNKILASNHQMI